MACAREALPMGECRLTKEEVDDIVDEMSVEYTGLSYHSLHRYALLSTCLLTVVKEL